MGLENCIQTVLYAVAWAKPMGIGGSEKEYQTENTNHKPTPLSV